MRCRLERWASAASRSDASCRASVPLPTRSKGRVSSELLHAGSDPAYIPALCPRRLYPWAREDRGRRRRGGLWFLDARDGVARIYAHEGASDGNC